ncbi:MAG: winged helix-turn-helix transcriptional regulator [Parvibaculaceae bacterium]
MMEQAGYGQFCPVSMAAEIFCSRWTPLVLRELLCGSTRFNDLRRGVPRMSPSLLSKRLRELEQAGLIATRKGEQSGVMEYHLTEAGKDLHSVVMSLGMWGQRWVESQLSLKNLDPSLLMWDMRRWLNPKPLPPRRCTIHFQFPELAAGSRDWWLVVENGAVDLCLFDPGHEVDLHIVGSLRSMTAIWMGLSTMAKETGTGQIEISGDREVENRMHQWLGLNPFAKEKRRAA